MKTETRVKAALAAMAAAGLLASMDPSAQVKAQVPLFSQDIILHETTTSTGMMGGGKTMTSTNYFSRNAMKRHSPDGKDTIIRFDQAKIINIDDQKKTYSEMTFDQMQQAVEKATSPAGEKKEQAEVMRKMMGRMMDSFEVTKEGPGESIAGYSTVKYHIKGMMDIEIWAAPDLKVPAVYYDALKMHLPPNPMFDMRKLYDEFKKIDGMTLKTETTMRMMTMEMKTSTVVTSVDKQPIPASTFEVPAGYAKVAATLGK